MQSEKDIFREYLRASGIRYSRQREQVLDVFLEVEDHLTVDQLLSHVKRKYPRIGRVTVYRAMKVICDAGLAEEVDLGDGVKRYEHRYNHEHHDHLICKRCGRVEELTDPEMERLQDELMRRFGFKPISHRLQLFGICPQCTGKEGEHENAGGSRKRR